MHEYAKLDSVSLSTRLGSEIGLGLTLLKQTRTRRRGEWRERSDDKWNDSDMCPEHDVRAQAGVFLLDVEDLL